MENGNFALSHRNQPQKAARKDRGAFFTPPAIADYLAAWAVGKNPQAAVLDPTCGEAVFLMAAGRRLRELGVAGDTSLQLFGADLHQESLDRSAELLATEDLSASFISGDFLDIPSPDQLGAPFPYMDAVIGNPPFIRYQVHNGLARKRSLSAALRQGVRLSGLASSWAGVLVHTSAFLKPDGRLAMVLPAELLTVNYAEPIRRWLRQRFAAVHLVMFERLQFQDALERVVLVIAQGSGGCDAFALWNLEDAKDLATMHGFDSLPVTPADEGKWNDLLLSIRQRQLFRKVTRDNFVSLRSLGSTELGTVTGANSFFAISDAVKQEYGLDEADLTPISPPGTRHLRGLSFTKADWQRLRASGERVWLLYPATSSSSEGLNKYIAEGERVGVPKAYKCSVRDPWWRPPAVTPPDLFFTYMSHRFPRLIANPAGVTYLNSMHGVRFREDVPRWLRSALPLLALNSVSLLGAEIFGRSYGGGVLKMEPREAALLPVPQIPLLEKAWAKLKSDRSSLDRQLRQGRWTSVLARVDDVLLRQTIGLSGSEMAELHEAARALRERRLGSEAGTVEARANRGESRASG
ncbi:MAG TPA: N-6 DNA methylase [Actinomycetota bacterium]|nr:N-6 DNA methylase [Actinomycetota bacterium]